ncbi:hypothetical protein HED60_05575 [Planctomycetales bacterium ZRK34]|nr:hypothetical protein HED60_05575 [Planctomycetales bacterium ZRK34]
MMTVAEINPHRRMGCEFEMTIPLVGTGSGSDVQRMLAEILTANGIRAVSRSYQHNPVPHGVDVAVEYDSSIRGESRWQGIVWQAVELKTKILSGVDDWERVVPRTLEIARYMGARVNRSCGHHVHIDLPEAASRMSVIRSLYNLVHKYEPIIYGVVAPSRRQNGYARSMTDHPRLLHGCQKFQDYMDVLHRWDRHHGLNLTHALASEPRIEFRYHAGTLDVAKARHWMRLLNRLVEHAVSRNCQAGAQVENSRKAFDAFRSTVGLRSHPGIYGKVSPELRETSKYLLRRWRQFNSPASGEDESDA